ncbi:hypothetical protein FNV43_RR05129 [Rhamnella rubrinervis]|uniref:M-phase phosphoprotein 6 n=1 Tax=Rhamnella rubrinervis TaxID=2594499 RepID=A0A8K0HKT1_9ROSA|nr:hypothetical protein FNV43_RR05129 [Rhamnella rubrinervis]
MAKRELSSTLRNLKFMQRAAQREETVKKEEVKPDGNFRSPSNITRKCVVIMEGDPHPGETKGRMSFKSFNPTIDKLNDETASLCQPECSASCSGIQSGGLSLKENGSSTDGAECSNADKPESEANGDNKRKQSEVVSESQYPRKSPKTDQGDHQQSPNKSKGSFRKPKGEKLDWNLLRRSKNESKRG